MPLNGSLIEAAESHWRPSNDFADACKERDWGGTLNDKDPVTRQ